MEKQKGLGKINFIMMIVAFVIIVLGMVLMVGEPSGEVYNADIFSVRRITVGPMISLFGFVVMIVAILWRRKK